MDQFILNEENKKVFLQIQPQFADEEKLALFYKRLEYLVNKGEDHINNIKLNGFKDNFEDIDFQNWFSFISNMIVYIEKVKGMVSGEEKLELLIAFITVIIINFVPVPEGIKLMLINKVIDFVPGIVDGLINVSKQMHKFSLNLFKKLRKSCKCSCFSKNN